MEPADSIERAIEQLHMSTRAETDRHILDDAFAALLGSASREPSGIGGRRIPAIRRIAIPVGVAAVILVGFVLFVGLPLQKTATLGQIQIALTKADNICISTFRAGEGEPFRQVWASKPLGVKLFKVGRGNQAQYTLWDAPNGAKMTKYVSSGYIQTEAIPEPMLAQLEKSEAESFGLVPFSDANDIPSEAQWSQLEDREVAADIPGSVVYDLTWATKETTSGVGMLNRWRLFADARTNIPKRAEWYTKLTPEDEYGFEIFAVVTYPSESDIDNLVRTTFGPRPSDDPEYRGTPGADR
ncbi:hypothetical protein ACFL5Z_10965 [Planctomycetota bacterium]